MSERIDRCPTCRAVDVDADHADRCKVRTAARTEAIAHGRRENVLIHGAKTGDLWAHMNTRTGDPETARDVVMAVIDLGWRPVVGKYDIWTQPAATESEATDV